ncbi:restriction endonuclease subunit S [Escherichia coli]|uniref:restriction endonuclease subunit S n=1 Tax=Escherichia TaxID=561 RepID=UPI000D01BF9B|nr:restriction endonuclease subunit S [Escherichia coli]EFB3357197.1 restriction endonuclease subunit S [Escherichia coli]EFD7007703.1 restriction endonuclease subunit S [Escherichia coli]EIL3111709.1 restriction endonuclease subunit S [Escherichia coli]EIP0508981.1 restriction endonuclease subunit S [Escherichia coli]EJN6501848.1 restriction endonuclease subunit S [Escherichia coli]
MVPKGWMLKQLSDIVKEKISYGIVQAGPHIPNGIPYIKSSDIRGAIDPASLQRTAPEIHYKYRRSAVHPGDIIFSLRGNIGETAIVPSNLLEANLTQGTARISVSGDQCNEFYHQQFAMDKLRNYINSLSKGSTFKEISLEELRKVKVLCAPLPEQKKIAQILSTWDKAITVTEKLLVNSQQQKKALMQQLLTGKKRLLDENGVRFSGEWEKGKFCDMANIDTGYAFKSKDFTQSDSGIPIIRMSDFKTGGLDVLGAAKVDRDSVNGLDKFKLRVGDFVFGMSGSLNNYGRVEKKDLPCYLNQRVGRILAKECANQAFITYLYLSDSIQQSILDKAAGAAQLNISISDLRSMVVYYPCIEEQQKIAAVLSAADAEISTLEKKLACLRDEKKALMQQLLTGKRRVKVDEAVAE